MLEAVRAGDAKRLREALEDGADADTRDSSGVPAVILAARLGLEGVPELLLDSGADPDATDEWGNALLIHAIRTGNVSLVSYVLGKGADADVSDSNGSPALSVAVSGMSVEVVSELVKGGASLGALNEHGYPVLAQAMKRADGTGFEMFTQLLQGGADPDAISMDGTCMTAVAYQEGGVRGPLMLAALARSTSTLPDEWRDRAGVSLLVRAIRERRFNWIEALTAAGADVHDKNAKGESCMLMAMRDRRSMGALQNGLDKKEGRISKSEDEDAEFNAYEALSKLDDLKNKKSKYDQYEIKDFEKEKMEVDNLVKK